MHGNRPKQDYSLEPKWHTKNMMQKDRAAATAALPTTSRDNKRRRCLCSESRGFLTDPMKETRWRGREEQIDTDRVSLQSWDKLVQRNSGSIYLPHSCLGGLQSALCSSDANFSHLKGLKIPNSRLNLPFSSIRMSFTSVIPCISSVSGHFLPPLPRISFAERATCQAPSWLTTRRATSWNKSRRARVRERLRSPAVAELRRVLSSTCSDKRGQSGRQHVERSHIRRAAEEWMDI